MLLISIDTSGKSGGITLAEGDATKFRVIESAPIAGGTFSAQLVPTLESLLRRHAAAVHDLDGFAVLSGPGSFTGLRVGLSAVKGLAEVLKKPVATVSLLEALAISSGVDGKVAAVVDAGRGEAYFGLYHVMSGHGSTIVEQLLSHADFIDAIKKELPIRFVSGDRKMIELGASAGVMTREAEHIDSELVARIGLQKLIARETVGVEELDANYIRRSDAEIFSKPKI